MQLCIDTFYQLYCKIRHSTLFTKQKIKWSSFYKSQGPRSDGHPKIITGWWKKCVHLVQVLCCTSSQEPLHTSLHTSLLHRYSMSFVTALIPNIVKHRVHVWVAAGPGRCCDRTGGVCCCSGGYMTWCSDVGHSHRQHRGQHSK